MAGLAKQTDEPGTLNNLAGAAQAAQGAMKQGIAQSNATTSGQMMQLGQQLKQNQGQVAQSVTNRGLGNTSVANTLAQAPLNTYNLASANVQNQGSDRLSQLYAQLAQLKLQGGEDLFSGQVNQTNAATASAGEYANSPAGSKSQLNNLAAQQRTPITL